jgi:spore germination protein KA
MLNIGDTMNNSLKENIDTLKSMFANSADFTVREMVLKSENLVNAAIITIEGMCSKEVIALSVINPLLDYDFGGKTGQNVIDEIKISVLTSSEIVEFDTLQEAVTFSTSGFAVLAVDGAEKMLAIGTQGFSFRGVSEPESEVVQRGSREGFTEPLRINMTLIRRRIKSPDLVFETVTVGQESQTQMMICYIQSRVSEKILNSVRQRLNSCDLATVLASGYLSEYLEDSGSESIFSGVGISERPDTVCGKLTEGRVAVLVDGTPAVIIIPHLFVEEFQSVDDYSNRPYYAAFIRILKYISFLIAVFLPAIYTAFAQFHPEYFPTGIMLKTSEALLQTPLPVTLEVILITFVYEIMREAGLRIPKPLGHAVSIVGALVIGESAVSAGIISSSTLMVVATAAICSYVTPALYPPIMVLRFAFVIIGGTLGLWGIVILASSVLVNMCAKTSLGVPYMSSLAPFSFRRMRDVFVRTGWRRLGKHTIRVQNFPETEDV